VWARSLSARPIPDSYFILDLEDLPHPLWVLREPWADAACPPLRPQYADLQCRRCGKFATPVALVRGVSADVRAPAGSVDAVRSNDDLLLVFQASRRLLERVAPAAARYFPLPGDSDYSVAYPNRIFFAPENARVYKPLEPAAPGEAFQVRARPCPRCGRSKETTFQPQWFRIPADTTLAAAHVEIAAGNDSLVLIASAAVGQAIERSNLSGWWARKV
jgi:hypothetical protein